MKATVFGDIACDHIERPGAARLGTVGRTVGDQEIQIARDREILVRGSNVMKGYYRWMPETEEAFSGGWFHTGDMAEIDAEGSLRLRTVRKTSL
jgi:long-chain acyl-CoA synthetase